MGRREHLDTGAHGIHESVPVTTVTGRGHLQSADRRCLVVPSRDETILGIPMGPVGPMGFPWEWESLG